MIASQIVSILANKDPLNMIKQLREKKAAKIPELSKGLGRDISSNESIIFQSDSGSEILSIGHCFGQVSGPSKLLKQFPKSQRPQKTLCTKKRTFTKMCPREQKPSVQEDEKRLPKISTLLQSPECTAGLGGIGLSKCMSKALFPPRAHELVASVQKCDAVHKTGRTTQILRPKAYLSNANLAMLDQFNDIREMTERATSKGRRQNKLVSKVHLKVEKALKKNEQDKDASVKSQVSDHTVTTQRIYLKSDNEDLDQKPNGHANYDSSLSEFQMSQEHTSELSDLGALQKLLADLDNSTEQFKSLQISLEERTRLQQKESQMFDRSVLNNHLATLDATV